MAELHPEAKSLLDSFRTFGGKSLDQMTVEEARDTMNKACEGLGGHLFYQGDKFDIKIPSQHVKDGIPAYVYRPLPVKQRPAEVYRPPSLCSKPSILVYFHGGGLVIGSRDCVETMCKTISCRSHCIVVSVEYRLAPEHLFPAMLEDAKTAMQWVAENKVALGGQADSKIGVAGDSSGGTLAASVCHYVPGIDYQVLIYPWLDARCSLESYKKYADGAYIISQNDLDWFQKNYLPKGMDKGNPQLSPLYHTNFKELPPTLFIVAEHDPVRDDSFEYAKKLADAGISNELLMVRGALHGFYTEAGHYKECCEKAYTKTVDFIVNHS